MSDCKCQECDYYRELLHETAETLTNAKSALVSVGKTTVSALEKLEAMSLQLDRAQPVLEAADAMVTCAEAGDMQRGYELGLVLTQAVIKWREKLPS